MNKIINRVENENILSKDKIANELLSILESEETNLIENCQKNGIQIQKLKVKKTKKNRYIVLIKENQKIPSIKKLLESYDNYSQRMTFIANKQEVKEGSGQRRVSLPKWIDGSPVTNPRPEFQSYKITHRINKGFSSAHVTLSEAILFFKSYLMVKLLKL